MVRIKHQTLLGKPEVYLACAKEIFLNSLQFCVFTLSKVASKSGTACKYDP